ncbi:MAG: hypothetical protein SPLUMA2_SPLUMAMAG2_00086 [uncultured Sulfurimonas sp.]|nr:MAG: hypothetical protein SPLUMA1_SPLUMAMAG1_00960 [uncultured Sulfurimonas sp.]CAI6151148.1 MAG: hypothetical protein SPLUMA2_SPLUMAMAG2_00086 [uncultured Sulfurimonas sp.]
MQAQKYVLDPKGIESAKEVLKPYRGISEKTKLIQELLTQGESIQMFSYSNRTKRFYYLFRVN